VGVVEEIEDGFIVVDYLNYNPSREKVLAAANHPSRGWSQGR
jgi:hypothetical protein